jgi:hypothetical protein
MLGALKLNLSRLGVGNPHGFSSTLFPISFVEAFRL